MDHPKEKHHKNEEWMQKIMAVSEANKKEELEVPTKGTSHKKALEHPAISKKAIILAVGLFLLTAAIRLYYVFFITPDPQNLNAGWYNDSYHHWQIAYLSKEIGFSHGFLKLWDLIGLEYFWGLLHPLVLALLFAITGSADIIISRFLNVFLGSINVVLIFLLGRKFFTWQVGLGAALLAAVHPVGVFTDVSGMQEPLAICMMLMGIYFWPQKPFLTAFFWFLASMGRAEYWLFSIGLIGAVLLRWKEHDKKVVLALAYAGLMLFYLKYLLDKSGNAIYPIYWNFMGNAAGEWQADVPLNTEQAAIKYVFMGVLALSVCVAAFIVIKKPRSFLFSLLGTGNFIFLAFFVGFTEYLKSYLPRFWVDRIFWLPYAWLGFLAAVVLLYYLPKFIPYVGRFMGWIGIAVIMCLLQFAWIPITTYSHDSEKIYQEEVGIGRQIGSYYKEGRILIPGNDPIITYQLYKSGIEGKNIRGEMFDPYFYFPTKDPYTNWGKNRKVVLDWLKKENIQLIVFDTKEDRYNKLIEKEPQFFEEAGIVRQYKIYRVVGN